jgi:GT2 family glycosyltransferase
MNPILILTRNNLALTKRCVESVRSNWTKYFSVWPLIVDNGSTDGTLEWADHEWVLYDAADHNAGVTAGWNVGLGKIFSNPSARHALVIGNDTVLPPSFYRTLLSVDVPFVTGVAVDNMEQAVQTPEILPLTPNPDFSAFLIRREAWEAIGPFDEGMKHYSSDQDYHIRGWRLGVPMMKASVPFFHERSSTIRNASPEERAEIEAQANKDRQYLRQKWGVSAGGPDYDALFTPELFGVERIRTSRSVPAQDTHDSISETRKE